MTVKILFSDYLIRKIGIKYDYYFLSNLIFNVRGVEMKKNFLLIILDKVNFKWQNFVEDMFGMGNFSCPSYQKELRKNKK